MFSKPSIIGLCTQSPQIRALPHNIVLRPKVRNRFGGGRSGKLYCDSLKPLHICCLLASPSGQLSPQKHNGSIGPTSWKSNRKMSFLPGVPEVGSIMPVRVPQTSHCHSGQGCGKRDHTWASCLLLEFENKMTRRSWAK